MSVATGRSVDGPEIPRRLDVGPYARLEIPHRWKREEHGRAAGWKGGQPSGGETTVIDPPTQLGVVGGKPSRPQ
jgi:hypothetical protein